MSVKKLSVKKIKAIKGGQQMAPKCTYSIAYNKFGQCIGSGS